MPSASDRLVQQHDEALIADELVCGTHRGSAARNRSNMTDPAWRYTPHVYRSTVRPLPSELTTCSRGMPRFKSMIQDGQSGLRCICGALLARDNVGGRCASCLAKARLQLLEAPE